MLLLVAGAIVNVAVAWGASLWATGPRIPWITEWGISRAQVLATYDATVGARAPDRLRSLVPESDDYVMVSARATSPGVEIICFAADPEMPGHHAVGLDWAIFLWRSGWPVCALESVGHPEVDGSLWNDGLMAPSLLAASPFPFPFDDWQRNIQRRPIWPGFAINTVFYAFVLWLLFAAPFALRRRRRIKRGLCPKCAYPVGTNEVCTECGAAVPRKVETSTSPNVQSPNP